LSISIAAIVILGLILFNSLYYLTEYNDRQAIAESITVLPPNPSRAINFSIFENSSFGIKMLYPSDWKKIEDFSGSWFRSSNGSINVRVESIPYPKGGLKELTTRQVNLTGQQFPEQTIAELNSTTFGHDYPAGKIVFTFPEDPSDLQGITYKEMQVWTTKYGRAYILSYFTTADAYDNYLPIIKKIINSFEIMRVN
jgi:eukaryotic-like serine/threonine-protein kinase